MPSWVRPPGRGHPNESTNDTGPATGHVEMAPEPDHRERTPAAALGGQADLRLSLLVLELLVQLVHGRLQVGESRIQCRPLGL